MTVSSTTTQSAQLEGNGVSTSFPFTFRVFSSSEVKVLLIPEVGDEEVLAENTDYTVSLNADQDNNPGGTVTYPVSGDPLAASNFLLLYSAVTSTQLSDMGNQGPQFPGVAGRALDRLTVAVNEIKESLSRALKFKRSSTQVDVVVPEPESGKFLKWNASGELINVDPGSTELAVPADDSVVEAKIADGAVTENKIGASAVTEGKIADGAITENKIGASAVTADKIATGAVSTAKLADGAVTRGKLVDGVLYKNGKGTLSGSFEPTTAIPNDGSQPQITEGDEVATATVSLTAGDIVELDAFVSCRGIGNTITVAVFESGAAGALNWSTQAAGTKCSPFPVKAFYTAASSASYTFSARAGAGAAGTGKAIVNENGEKSYLVYRVYKT